MNKSLERQHNAYVRGPAPSMLIVCSIASAWRKHESPRQGCETEEERKKERKEVKEEGRKGRGFWRHWGCGAEPGAVCGQGLIFSYHRKWDIEVHCCAGVSTRGEKRRPSIASTVWLFLGPTQILLVMTPRCHPTHGNSGNNFESLRIRCVRKFENFSFFIFLLCANLSIIEMCCCRQPKDDSSANTCESTKMCLVIILEFVAVIYFLAIVTKHTFWTSIRLSLRSKLHLASLIFFFFFVRGTIYYQLTHR